MHVVWAVIYFAAFAIEAVILRKGIFADINFSDMLKLLLGQIFLGHTINQTMWFQVNLIFITLIFAAVFSKLELRKTLALTVCIVIIAFALQYSGINFKLFGGMRYAVKYPLGRICEMLPLACIGLLFVNYDIMNKLSKRKTLSIFLCVIFLAGVISLRRLLNTSGFGYAGLYLNLSAIFLTAIFYLLPMNELPDVMKKIINSISCLTPGVYCMHRLIGTMLKVFHRSNSFSWCIVIFCVCMAVSFILARLFGKLSKYITG